MLDAADPYSTYRRPTPVRRCTNRTAPGHALTHAPATGHASPVPSPGASAARQDRMTSAGPQQPLSTVLSPSVRTQLTRRATPDLHAATSAAEIRPRPGHQCDRTRP